ncbi:MAG TPA: LacI family DNA-binding transcriptional regulator [Cellulomonas sp.]
MVDRTTTRPAPSGGAALRAHGTFVAPTLEQVAERAGVSRSTASRAINGGLRVSPEAMESVAAAVADLGYTPNRAARSLVTRRTDSVALVVPEPDERVLSDPFFAGVLNGVSSPLAESDLQLLLIIARPGDSARTVRYLRAGHVDGAIVVSHHRDDSIDQALEESGLPCVFIGRPLTPRRTFAFVDTDNVRGAQLATEHLIGLGRRRIGTIAGPADMSAGLDRLAGWRQALRAAGLPDDAVVHGDFTVEGGETAARRVLAEHPDLDALFIASDLMAVGALPVIQEAGHEVPGDIAVVGYDNSGLASTTKPNLTTVVQPVIAMARAAGEELVGQLHGHPARPTPQIFAPELVVRGSA